MHSMYSESKGEQLTIQLGHYANYVGTHYWNFQDEVYLRCMDKETEPLYQVFRGSIYTRAQPLQLYRFNEYYNARISG